MREQFQNLSEDQRNDLLRLLQKFEDVFNGTLCKWKMDHI